MVEIRIIRVLSGALVVASLVACGVTLRAGMLLSYSYFIFRLLVGQPAQETSFKRTTHLFVVIVRFRPISDLQSK